MALNTEMELMNLERKATGAVNLAASRGYKVPADYTKAQRMAQEAAKVRDAQQPAPRPMPTKIEDVTDWIDQTAADRAEWQAHKTVAAELHGWATRKALSAAVEAVPGFLGQICDDFDALAQEFAELWPTTPGEVHGHMSSEQFEQHAKLLRTVEGLSAAAGARGQLALLADEGEEIGSDGIWLILNPHGSTTLGTVREILKDFRGGFPRTIEEWVRLERAGIAMARGGEVTARTKEFAELTFAASNGADGGLLDRSYDDAHEMRGTHVPRVVRGMSPAIREFMVESAAS